MIVGLITCKTKNNHDGTDNSTLCAVALRAMPLRAVALRAVALRAVALHAAPLCAVFATRS